MPTYDYECRACKHRFEHFQSMKDRVLTKCPACGKARLERLIGTGAALIFKGSGFYQTDYRSEGYKKAAEADKPSDSAKASESSKSESPKPAETPKAEAAPKVAKEPAAKPRRAKKNS